MKPAIFLIHFAGGSAYSFQFLYPYLHMFDIYALELPGRGKRIKEEIIRNTDEAIDDILHQIKRVIQPGKDIILGHSMGALVGLHVTQRLEQINKPPRYLMVSGNAGPMTYSLNKAIYKMDEQMFKTELKKMGGVSKEFLEDPDLFGFFEPILRADFKLAHDLSFLRNVNIQTPIYAIMGTDEKSYDKIENWGSYTSGRFNSLGMKGGHFFIYNNASHIAHIANQCALSSTNPVSLTSVGRP